MITATIGRAGAIPAQALFENGATVQDALNKFGLTVGSEERIYSPTAIIVSNGDNLVDGTYTIAKQQENGSK